MRLFLLECKLLGKHKLYGLFLFSFLLLAYVTIQPFSIGENFAPMDAEHIWVRMLLEDSEQDELENEYMGMELEANQEALEELELSLASPALSLEGRLNLTEQVKELREKNNFLSENMVIQLSDMQKDVLDENAQKLLQAIGDGNYSKKQILEMDTAIFQQLEIAMSKQEINKILDTVNETLGNVSHFARKAPPSGENHRISCVEMGGYNDNLQNLYQADGTSQQITHKEMLAYYEEQLQTSGYIQMFTPFLCDKLAFILCLSMAFILAIFPLENQSCTQDVIAMKRISPLIYMMNKCFSIVCMVFLPCLAFGLIIDVKLCMQAIDWGYTINPFHIPAAMCIILLPEILFLTAIGMFVNLLFHNAIVPFLIEALFFGISVDDFYGKYGFNRPLIRFNLKANTQLIDYYLRDIIENRIFFTILAFIIFILVFCIYYIQKYSNLFSNFSILYEKKEFVHVAITKIKTNLEKRQQKKKLHNFGRNTNIYQYLFQLGYKKGVLYCICLDVAAMLLVGEMGGYHLFQRFLPLNGIILFSSIGFAEQKGNFKSLIFIKDRIHIRQIEFAMSAILSLLFVWGIGTFILSNSNSVCIFVSLFTIGLGCIYSFISKCRYGVTGGTFSAVMVYIWAAITIL